MTQPWWHPDLFMKKIPYLEARARIFAEVRQFFNARGYLEVETPALQVAPCMEAHIQAFRTDIISADRQRTDTLYLHTSPEFAMKKLLVAGLPKIYNLARVFRNAEGSSWHSPEFSMIEWYQRGMTYEQMMDETIDLVRHVTKAPIDACGRISDVHQPWEKITVVEALKKYADVDISNNLCDLEHIRREAARIGVYVSPHDDWENALLKILMDRVEPKLGSPVPAIIYDYPVSMAALSRPKPSDSRFAERFEVYVCGIELANAFGELTDPVIQRERFLYDVALRKKTYGDDFPVDEDFLNALEFGLPMCSGNALGLDRLVMLVTGAEDIDLVLASPVTTDVKRGWTALHYAADAEARGIDVEKIVRMLLEAGADPHAADEKGDTAFNIAAPSSPVTGRLMTLHWLEGKTAKGLNERSGSHGSTLAQYLAKWLTDDEFEESLTPAIKQGMKIDIPNATGWTPLMAAAAMGRVHIVDVLSKLYGASSKNSMTIDEYKTVYKGHAVVYGVGLTAKMIAQARLHQDRGLNTDEQKSFHRIIELLSA